MVNVANILSGCKRGQPLFMTPCIPCTLVAINFGNTGIIARDIVFGSELYFDEYGNLRMAKGRIVLYYNIFYEESKLYPSEANRDWSNVKVVNNKLIENN